MKKDELCREAGSVPSRLPLLGMTPEQLRTVAAECGMPRFAANQMARWLYQKRVDSIDAMTDLSLESRRRLAERYVVGLRSPKLRTLSADGTVKYLFDGVGGRDVEAVMIPDHDRATLCVSSQAGCRMNCRFCMTGRGGFQGNLTSADILNQILSIDESERLTNIVFMGMGEPMDNYDAVLRAIEVLTSKWGFAWSPKRITVSSIGKLDNLRRLIEETKVHVAISLHSPFAAERESLMPVERAYPAVRVLDFLRGYDWSHQRRLSLEYIVWAGLNDDMRHADALARQLKGLDARVNLIRFHRIPGADLSPADEQRMTAFRDRLNGHGITATIRASRGEDIMAACGMLAGNKAEAHGARPDGESR